MYPRSSYGMKLRVRSKVPALKAGKVNCGIWEPQGAAIDVHGLLQGYLKGFKNRGWDTDNVPPGSAN